MLDKSTLGEAADVNPVIKFLPHTCKIWWSIAVIASTILYSSCGKWRGIGGTYMPCHARMRPLHHLIYHRCDKGLWRQSLLLPSRCCNVCGRNLITGLTSTASPRADISSTSKVGQKLGVSLPLLTCSPSAWPSQLLYCRVWKSQRDLWITLYFIQTLSLATSCNYYELPWASDHTFYFNVLQFVLGFYSHCVKNILEMVSLVLQLHFTSNNAYSSLHLKFLLVTLKALHPEYFLQIVFSARIFIVQFNF
jgi:hypothetical protein